MPHRRTASSGGHDDVSVALDSGLSVTCTFLGFDPVTSELADARAGVSGRHGLDDAGAAPLLRQARRGRPG
ncbi:putative protein OS=Streptomyces aurantiogriseus OX=66870 GN=GCM10010251_02360 PE=4 SV=1 [Streptomyces aurantiogriseus]|uniref:Uncharacterized protein n=2 Tax=Streptomyces aurantiogriseus TaxID=66870 RepID=A0A918EYQ9_9ACTN|nr:hypothetical protein GCM10010251_02360 [Streptomyces aurantiogriseus]